MMAGPGDIKNYFITINRFIMACRIVMFEGVIVILAGQARLWTSFYRWKFSPTKCHYIC